MNVMLLMTPLATHQHMGMNFAENINAVKGFLV